MELSLLIFFIFVILITCLQFLNRQLLKQILPSRWNDWTISILIIIHTPLTIYGGIRLIGVRNSTIWLQSLAQFGIFFQLITFILLLTYLISSIGWQWIKGCSAKNYSTIKSGEYKKFLQKTSLIGICLAICCAIHGAIEARSEPYIVRQELKFIDLPPGLDGLRIVQISDLHAGPMVKQKQMEKWRYLAEQEKPELLLITGDIVDSLPEEAKIVAEVFNNFCAPLGCFAVLGNHDYFINPYPIWNLLSDAGIHFLENSNVLISRNGDQLALLGLQDSMASHKRAANGRFYGSGPQPALATQNIPSDTWRICLSHRPSNWYLAKKSGARLTLSGHTHGGQVNFIPSISSALLLGKRYTGGLYKEGEYYLYVNRGLGAVALPIRINAPPEITVITLRKG